jgi:hypothetical protein
MIMLQLNKYELINELLNKNLKYKNTSNNYKYNKTLKLCSVIEKCERETYTIPSVNIGDVCELIVKELMFSDLTTTKDNTKGCDYISNGTEYEIKSFVNSYPHNLTKENNLIVMVVKEKMASFYYIPKILSKNLIGKKINQADIDKNGMILFHM